MNLKRIGSTWVNLDLLEAIIPDKYQPGKHVLFARGHIITTDLTAEELDAALGEDAAIQCVSLTAGGR